MNTKIIKFVLSLLCIGAVAGAAYYFLLRGDDDDPKTPTMTATFEIVASDDCGDANSDDVLKDIEDGVKQRLEKLGYSEATVKLVEETSKLEVTVPNVSDDEAESIINVLQKRANLEFWAVCDSVDTKSIGSVIAADEDLADKINLIGYDGMVGTVDKADMEYVSNALAALKQQLPMNVKLVWSYKSVDGTDDGEFDLYALKGRTPLMDGRYVADAYVDMIAEGKVGIVIDWTEDGFEEFADVTGNNIGKSIAIVVDDVMYSAPRVMARINGSALIQGVFSIEEAEELAAALSSKPLPVAIKCVDYKIVK